MRPRCLVLSAVLLACACKGASAPSDGERSLTADAWTRRCAARIEAANRAVAIFMPPHSEEMKIDAAPYAPRIRFAATMPNGADYAASVSHGRACVEFEFPEDNQPWIGGSTDGPGALRRYRRRLQDDEAWIAARKVPTASIEPLRREFEAALEACLVDAERVRLADPPRDSCLDRLDHCPDAPLPDGGCSTP